MATNTSFDQLIANLEKERQAANVANQKRYEQMQAIFDEIVTRYTPGGTFEQKFEQQLGTRKQKEVGQAKQDLISSGLFGTERLAGTERQWEQEVGEPARLSAQDLMMQRLSAAQLGKAEAIERVEDTGPDYATIAGLAMQAGEQPINISTGGGGGYESIVNTGRETMNVRPAPTMQEQMDMEYRQAQRMAALQGKSDSGTAAPAQPATSPEPADTGKQYYIPGYNNNMPLSESQYMPLLSKWQAAGGQGTGKTLGDWLANPTTAKKASGSSSKTSKPSYGQWGSMGSYYR